jgi:hypothetical protein
MKTKKFKDFIANMEVGLDLVKNENNNQTIDLTKYTEIYESKSPEELKKAAETIGLDLTKNLSKRIDVI